MRLDEFGDTIAEASERGVYLIVTARRPPARGRGDSGSATRGSLSPRVDPWVADPESEA